MFNYDYTLDEGGIEKSEETNKQEVSNRLAKESVKACSSLGGYVQGENLPSPNMLTRGILESLLTPYLANRLGQEKPEEVSFRCSLIYRLYDWNFDYVLFMTSLTTKLC